MAQTRPSPTLSRAFTRLGRFLAPYGVRRARSGAGSIPWSCRIRLTVFRAMSWARFASAPRMRVYPHGGFSTAIRTTRSATSRGVIGRPRRRRALGVGQAKWTWATLLPEDPILLPEIIDHVFLVAVHPASGREYEEAQSVGHSLRLLREQPLAPTLFGRFANLGRFVAPYGKFRNECLSLEWFRNRMEAKIGIERWRRHYNEERPQTKNVLT